jgi:hypothetical protein
MNFEESMFLLVVIPLIALVAIWLEFATTYTHRHEWLRSHRALIKTIAGLFSGLTIAMVAGSAIVMGIGAWGSING